MEKSYVILHNFGNKLNLILEILFEQKPAKNNLFRIYLHQCLYAILSACEKAMPDLIRR